MTEAEQLVELGPPSRSFADLLADRNTACVVMGASKDPNAKITLLFTCRDGSGSGWAVKVPTTATAASAVAAERRVLLELAARLGPAVRETVPRVLGVVPFEGRPALLVTALPGTPMFTSYHRWRHTARPREVKSDFAAVTEWLTRFQADTRSRRASMDMGRNGVEALARRFSDEPRIDAVVDELTAVHDRLAGTSTVRTAVHGDLWQGNVLLQGGRVSGLVDWEAASAEGEPLRDVARFAIMYALYLDRHTRRGRPVTGHPGLCSGEWGAALRYAIDGTGWFPDMFRGFVQQGLRRSGGDPARWRDVVIAGIAEVATVTDDPEFGRRHLHLLTELGASC